jgi:hypothetical protein
MAVNAASFIKLKLTLCELKNGIPVSCDDIELKA